MIHYESIQLNVLMGYIIFIYLIFKDLYLNIFISFRTDCFKLLPFSSILYIGTDFVSYKITRGTLPCLKC